MAIVSIELVCSIIPDLDTGQCSRSGPVSFSEIKEISEARGRSHRLQGREVHLVVFNQADPRGPFLRIYPSIPRRSIPRSSCLSSSTVKPLGECTDLCLFPHMKPLVLLSCISHRLPWGTPGVKWAGRSRLRTSTFSFFTEKSKDVVP